MNGAFFRKAIQASAYGSMRSFSEKVHNRLGRPLGIANLSRTLSGEREMLVHEAEQFARLLHIPLLEVLRQAGARLPKACPHCGHDLTRPGAG